MFYILLGNYKKKTASLLQALLEKGEEGRNFQTVNRRK
jgi:hypothetical protein